MHRLGLIAKQAIPTGRVQLGHLRRLTPVSEAFGYDRTGGPVDRYYIEHFLESSREVVVGRVLEIEDNEYTLRYKNGPVESEVLHVHDGNPKATIVGDLTHAPHIESNRFDCIILTQTLHLIFDFRAALATCHRILKPGGVLLLTVPGITPIDHGQWKDAWFWSFTEASIRKLAADCFAPENTRVESWGNVLAATSFLYGLGVNDLRQNELDFRDPHFPVVITAYLKK